MFFKKPRHRVFDYTPRFYKPEDDKDEIRKRRLGFRRQSKVKRKRTSPMIWAVLIVIVIYVYLRLSGKL